MQGKLTIERMCHLAGVSRAGFYRFLEQEQPVAADMELRAQIHEIFLEHKRRYGYRRVSAELRRRGLQVNHKRVARLMREDNLLAVQPRSFRLTTDSEHDCEVFLNLASRMKLTGKDQLWVADITYIRLAREFVYLAVILDAFSRKVIGWALDRTLTARLTITAIQQALAARQPAAGVVHHSDRGIQYACGDYVSLLRSHGLIPSMSRPANPYDNASCESFMKTLKREEIYAHEYRSLEHLLDNVAAFINDYYNRKRLHSALGYQTPEEFEQAESDSAPAASMSFFRHREIYRSDTKERGRGQPLSTDPSLDYRCDESPSGYSSAGCSPTEPASASPDDDYDAARHKKPKPKNIKR